jgi:uncharacterized glyoxalase superfamily protein PhnB
LAFYRDTVGFPLSFSDESMGWAEFDLGTARIGLERCDRNDPESTELVGRFVGVSIRVEDVNAVFDRLTSRGVEFTATPQKQPWGGTLAHFKDPDGNILTLLG